MLSKQDIKDYEFSSIEEYYDYIVSTELNGQFSQVDNLIKQLSPTQKKEAIDYLDSIYFPQDEYVDRVMDKIVKSF
jgi:hypothetical protein